MFNWFRDPSPGCSGISSGVYTKLYGVGRAIASHAIGHGFEIILKYNKHPLFSTIRGELAQLAEAPFFLFFFASPCLVRHSAGVWGQSGVPRLPPPYARGSEIKEDCTLLSFGA